MSVSRTNAMDAYLEAIYVIKAEGETVLASRSRTI